MDDVPHIIKRAKVAEHLELGDFPYQFNVPPLGGRDARTVAVSAATVDDLALGLVGLRAEARRLDMMAAELRLKLDPDARPGALVNALGVDDDLARLVYLRTRDEIIARQRDVDHNLDKLYVMYSEARRAGALGADNALDALFEAARAAENADAAE